MALLSASGQVKTTEGPIANSANGGRMDYKLTDKGVETSGFVTSEQTAKLPVGVVGPGDVKATFTLEDRVFHQLPS